MHVDLVDCARGTIQRQNDGKKMLTGEILALAIKSLLGSCEIIACVYIYGNK